ncbi:hypothetical protein MWH30_12780 [Fuchsiella alkaliacetigena]|nr:hypothetical protein [Fuchsiella alkaliacetigena]
MHLTLIKKLASHIVERFLNYLVPYPVGTKVELDNGCEGVVSKINKQFFNQ